MIRLGYSGVHLGWGWRLAQGYSRNNEVAYNRIRHHMMRMDDGGGLYTSGPQPNTTIHHNYVSGRLHHSCGACMYRDDGSAFIVDSFNVCDMPTGASQPALLAVVRSLLCPVSTLCTLGGGLTMCCTAGGDAHRASWSAILFHVGELQPLHHIDIVNVNLLLFNGSILMEHSEEILSVCCARTGWLASELLTVLQHARPRHSQYVHEQAGRHEPHLQCRD